MNARPGFLWVFATAGAAALVGLLAGIEPRLAIGVSLGLIFVLVILADLTAGFAAFTFLTFVALVPINAGPAVSFVKAAGLLLVISWIASVTTRPNAETDFFRKHAGLALIVVLLLVWVALSQLWAQDSAAVRTALSRFALNAALLVIAFTAIRNEKNLVTVVVAFVAGCAVSALYGILQPPDPTQLDRLAGTLGNPNELAAILVVGAVLSVGLIGYSRKSPALRVLALMSVLVCVAGVLMTLSRTGLVAMGVAGLAGILFGGKWRPQISALVVTVTLLSLGYFAFVASPEARDRVAHPGSGTGRVDLWKVGTRMISAHPLNGVGASNFPITSVNFLLEPGALTRSDFIISSPKVAHNTYLEVFAELGIVGFALFMALLLICIRCCVHATRIFARDGPVRLEILSRSILIGLIGLLAADFFESEEFQKALWLMLALCPVVFAIAQSKLRGDAPTESA